MIMRRISNLKYNFYKRIEALLPQLLKIRSHLESQLVYARRILSVIRQKIRDPAIDICLFFIYKRPYILSFLPRQNNLHSRCRLSPCNIQNMT